MIDCYILVGGEVVQPPRVTRTALPRIIVILLSNAMYLNNLVSIFSTWVIQPYVYWPFLMLHSAMYLLGSIPALNRIYLIDKDMLI